jgi:hypothetical protein
MINSRVHAVIDYVVGILLLIVPYALHFNDGSAAQYVPQILGVLVLAMSLLTDYELSVAKLIPYQVHLAVDLVQALTLLTSPWLFSFGGRIWWPHVLVGVAELLVIALSWRKASHSRQM